MGDVHHLHHAIDEGEPDRDDEEPGGIVEPVDEDGGRGDMARRAASADIQGQFLAPFMPSLIQSVLLMPSGGVTHSAG